MFLHKWDLSARSVFLLYSIANSLFLSTIFTVDLVYQVQVAHLTPLHLVLVGTFLEIVCFLCQVPTGVLADVFGRRPAIILGTFLIGAGFMLEGSLPHFIFILLAQVFWGVGATFTDGALEAWISGEVSREQIGPVFARSIQLRLVGGLLGAWVSVGLASIRLNLPIVLGSGLVIGPGVFLLLFMPEHSFRPAAKEERPTRASILTPLRHGIRLLRLRAALTAVSIILSPVLLLFAYATRKVKQEQTEEVRVEPLTKVIK